MEILVPLMQGFEEVELVSIVDVLRRGGVRVLLARDSLCDSAKDSAQDSAKDSGADSLRDSAADSPLVRGAHDIFIKADCKLSEINPANLAGIALAGGFEGMTNLKNSREVRTIVEALNKRAALIAAICASPIVLAEFGVLKNRFTCYPGCEKMVFEAAKNSTPRLENAALCVDENIITANGPASAIIFGLAILRHLLGESVSEKVGDEMLFQGSF